MSNRNNQGHDCAVCLQKCNYPTQLPCGHIFCFLCVKGVAIQSKKCALCRAEIPPDYLDHPEVLEATENTHRRETSNEYQWYYEGRNGWWKYDESSNEELELAYSSGETKCQLLLAGALYWVDFQRMIQMQSRDPTKRRRVRRDTPMLPAKGIAGIKLSEIRPRHETKSESEESSSDNNSSGDIVPVVHDDSDDASVNENVTTSATESNGLSDILQRIRSLQLQLPGRHGNTSRNFPEGNS